MSDHNARKMSIPFFSSCPVSDWLKKDQEAQDVEVFLHAYLVATGIELEIEEYSEAPDFVCVDPEGNNFGVELTQIARSRDQKFWDEVLHHRTEMDPEEFLDRAVDGYLKKSLHRYGTPYNLLVLKVTDIDFDLAVGLFRDVPLEDLADSGFDEVWLVDYFGIRQGTHRTVQLFGLYPERLRTVTRRPDTDLKPYG